MYHYSFNVGFDRGLKIAEDKLKDPNFSGISIRGLNYDKPPLLPPHDDVKCTVWGAANFGKDFKNSDLIAKIEGRFLHKVYSVLITEANGYIFSTDNSISDLYGILEHMQSIRDSVLDFQAIFQKDPVLRKNTETEAKAINTPIFRKDKGGVIVGYSQQFEKINQDMKKIWDYESLLMSARISYYISNTNKPNYDNSHLTKEDLVNYAMPFIVEKKINGELIGLVGESTVDIFVKNPTKVIIDIKTGAPDYETDKLQVTGYALAYEAKYSEPIDIGCILYTNLTEHSKLPFFYSYVFVIDDGLRNAFAILRDKEIIRIEEKAKNE